MTEHARGNDLPDIKPPLAGWTTTHMRPTWAELRAQHGDLIAVKLRGQTSRWSLLDDEIRKACRASHATPTGQRGLYLAMDGWTIIARDDLDQAVANLSAARGLQHLQLRAVPDA
jgi:hypothetical protein